MAAAAPFIPMAVGAGLGAALNKDNPMAGAALGAVGGMVAGPAVSAGLSAAGAGTAVAPAATYGAGLSGAGVGGQQAAMLAAQTAEFGAPGLAATQAAFSPGIASGAGGILGGMSDPTKLGLRMLAQQAKQPRPQQNQPVIGAPAQMQIGSPAPMVSFAQLSPYARRRGIIG